MKLLFLVNGPPHGAAAQRAQAFANRLPPHWRIAREHRPARKSAGVFTFLHRAATLRPAVIYVMDTAYTGVLAGVLAQRLLGSRLVLDTGDAAYELAKSSGFYSSRQLALIHAVERLALRQADQVIVRGSRHKALLEQSGQNRVHFIPDGVDHAAVTPVDSQALRADLGLTGHFVVGLVGTMSWSERHRMCYGWDIIEALGLLKDRKFKALLVGDGAGRARLEARARELSVDRQVVFTGSLPFHCLPRYVCAMDACVSTQSNDVVGQVRTTGKLPLYLACGRYVIATDVGEAARVLPGVGALLPYQGVRDDRHPSRLAKLLFQQRTGPRWSGGHQARAVSQQHFDYARLAVQVQAVCELAAQV